MPHSLRTSQQSRHSYDGGPVVAIIGRVHVGRASARVMWTQQGDTVNVDFEDDGARYATVTGLDTDEPELTPTQGYRYLVGPAGQRLVRDDVRKAWRAYHGEQDEGLRKSSAGPR